MGNTETSITKRIGDRWLKQVIKKNNKNEIIETKEITNFEPSNVFYYVLLIELNEITGELDDLKKIMDVREERVEDERPRNEVTVQQNQNKGFWFNNFLSYFFK